MPVARDWRIAIHEAGHAVAARVLRLPGCGGGACAVESHAGAFFSLDHDTDSVAALLGGGAAEVLFFGDYDRAGNRVDRERVAELLARCGRAHDEERLWDFTQNLLRPYRSIIGPLAVQLWRHGQLTGAEINRLLPEDMMSDDADDERLQQLEQENRNLWSALAVSVDYRDKCRQLEKRIAELEAEVASLRAQMANAQ